jgi:hypothetical protein
MPKIYESPDNGDTVYEREFGTLDRTQIKQKRGKRIMQRQAAIKKQVKIAKSHGLKVEEPHRYAKHHALDCGVPNCPMCANPRRQGKKTLQERKADEAGYD